MKLTIEVKANVGDAVNVPALELRSAVVRSIGIDTEGASYQIAYFHNGDRKTAWVFAEEFDIAEPG